MPYLLYLSLVYSGDGNCMFATSYFRITNHEFFWFGENAQICRWEVSLSLKLCSDIEYLRPILARCCSLPIDFKACHKISP